MKSVQANNIIQYIEVQTVSYCNAQCVVCPWRDIRKETKLEYISDEIWARLMEQVAEIKPKRMIPYLNNEPLIDKSICDRIKQIQKTSPTSEIEISTNGVLLNTSISRQLLEMNVTDINISLFGSDEETQTRMMGKQINYKKVHDNVVELIQMKKEIGSTSNINVVKIVDSPYLQNSEIDFSYWRDKGANVFKYGYLNRSENTGRLVQRDAQKTPCGCELNRHKERIYIDVKGNVTFCCHDWRKQYHMGNIMETSLQHIFNSTYYNEIREMVEGQQESPSNFLCRKCKLCL